MVSFVVCLLGSYTRCCWRIQKSSSFLAKVRRIVSVKTEFANSPRDVQRDAIRH